MPEKAHDVGVPLGGARHPDGVDVHVRRVAPVAAPR
jgi:hypothetical protein